MDWQTFFFSPQNGWPDRLQRLSRKRFPQDDVLAEEAYTFVLERISEDGWKRMNTYQGNATPSTFLATCMRNALEDFSHKRFGKPHTPAWLKSLGGMWLDIYRWLCLERMAEGNILDRATSDMKRAVEDVRSIIRTIRGRIPNCGQSQQHVSIDDESEDGSLSVPELRDKGGDLDTLDVRERVEQAMLALAHLLGDAESMLPVPKQLSLQVSDEEAVALRLVFVDGMKYAEAARALGEPEHTVRRRVQRCLLRLREELGDDFPHGD